MPFLRIVVAFLVILVAHVPAAARVPTPLIPWLIFSDDQGGCFFLGDVSTPRLGGSIGFENKDTHAHDVTQRERFWSFVVGADVTKTARIHAAGTYVAWCDGDHGRVVARTKVKAPSDPPSPNFSVTWADADAAAAWTYDVQYRIGSGGWRAWKHGTSLRSASFDGAGGKTYAFQARVTRVGGTTGWSPAKKVTT